MLELTIFDFATVTIPLLPPTSDWSPTRLVSDDIDTIGW